MKKIILPISFMFCAVISFAQNVGINNTNPQAALDLQGDLRLRSASLVVNNGVYSSLDITTQKSSTYILTRPVGIPPFGVTTISGINGGIDGRVVTFFNNSPDIRIVSETGSLTSNIPANRINTGTNEEVLLHKWGSIVLRYDGVLSRWTVQNSNNTSGLVNSSSSPWLRNSTNPFDIYTNYPGNVGIGTSTPTNKLQINTDVSNYGLVHTDGTIAIGTYLNSATLGGGIGTKTNHSFNLFTNNSAPQMTLTASGKVGVGYNSPNYKLDVNGDGSFFSDPIISSPTSFTTGGVLNIRHGQFTIYNLLKLDGQSIQAQYNYQGLGNSPFQLSLNPFGGKVVTGNLNSIEQFEVKTASSNYGMVHTDGTISVGTYVGGAGNGGYVGTKSNHPLYLFSNDGGPALTVATSGNIGIGTNYAPSKLSVNGNIICEEVNVQLRSNWPDYVFGDNHPLLPLNELEKYIDTHNHLPNIPAAATVEKNGLKVGEMQTKMMEKIEELTLYIIALKKQVDDLQNQIKK